MAVTGPVGLILVPSKIMASGNPAATVQNIIANEFLIRIGIISNLICQESFIFLALALYRLFKETNEKYSKLMFSPFSIKIYERLGFDKTDEITEKNGINFIPMKMFL